MPRRAPHPQARRPRKKAPDQSEIEMPAPVEEREAQPGMLWFVMYVRIGRVRAGVRHSNDLARTPERDRDYYERERTRKLITLSMSMPTYASESFQAP